MGYTMKASENKEYIESGRWKCDKSPGGAHHWIIGNHQMTCKYCNCSKQADTSGPGWSKPEVK